MIGKLLTGKWIYVAVAVLVLSLLAGLWALNARNEALSAQIGELEQRNAQLTQSLKEQAEQYDRLSNELARRDKIITQAQQAKAKTEREARETIQTLRQALSENECAAQPHPSVVADSLRSASDPEGD